MPSPAQSRLRRQAGKPSNGTTLFLADDRVCIEQDSEPERFARMPDKRVSERVDDGASGGSTCARQPRSRVGQARDEDPLARVAAVRGGNARPPWHSTCSSRPDASLRADGGSRATGRRPGAALAGRTRGPEHGVRSLGLGAVGEQEVQVGERPQMRCSVEPQGQGRALEDTG